VLATSTLVACSDRYLLSFFNRIGKLGDSNVHLNQHYYYVFNVNALYGSALPHNPLPVCIDIICT